MTDEIRDILEHCHRALNNLVTFIGNGRSTPLPIEELRDRIAVVLERDKTSDASAIRTPK